MDASMVVTVTKMQFTRVGWDRYSQYYTNEPIYEKEMHWNISDISISISEAIKVRGNVKYVIWGNRGERKSQIPRLISLPVSAPFLSYMHPKFCIFWWWCLWWGSIHCSAHPGWDKKRDDDGFCFISCFLFKAQASSLFHRDLFILSWCLRLTCSNYRTQVWSLYCLAL